MRARPTSRGAPFLSPSSGIGILSLRVRERIPGVRRTSRGGALHRKAERNSRVVPPFPKSPRCLSLLEGNLFPPALPRLSSRGSTHTMVARGTTLWESLVGKPRGKASRESHRSLDPREGNRDTAAAAWEESARACPFSRQRLTPLGRIQKYPKIHVSTGEKSSDSGTDSTQGFRLQHRRERNHERPPSNSHEDWPFLRPGAGVPVIPVVSRAPAATRENPGGSPLQAR